MSEVIINKSNFENELLRSDKPVLLDFYADWCGPCKMLSPVLGEIADEYADVLKVAKVNVDDEPELAMKITVNQDEAVVKTVREGLKRTGGYCPCRLEQTEDTKCMCKEFKEQIADPNFEGFCHCMLYYKSI